MSEQDMIPEDYFSERVQGLIAYFQSEFELSNETLASRLELEKGFLLDEIKQAQESQARGDEEKAVENMTTEELDDFYRNYGDPEDEADYWKG